MGYSVAVVGATGNVGREILDILEERGFPVDEVIDTMGEIGREMDVRYRETAGGGLAATPTGRRLAKERLVQLKPRPRKRKS